MDDQLAKLFDDASKLKNCSIKAGTPAITIGAAVGALVANRVQHWLDDSFRTNLEADKKLLSLIPNDYNSDQLRMIPESTLDDLISLRKKALIRL